jgi:hypothetical protein
MHPPLTVIDDPDTASAESLENSSTFASLGLPATLLDQLTALG